MHRSVELWEINWWKHIAFLFYFSCHYFRRLSCRLKMETIPHKIFPCFENINIYVMEFCSLAVNLTTCNADNLQRRHPFFKNQSKVWVSLSCRNMQSIIIYWWVWPLTPFDPKICSCTFCDELTLHHAAWLHPQRIVTQCSVAMT